MARRLTVRVAAAGDRSVDYVAVKDATFEVADGVVARAASRLVTVASGLDPHALGIPETTWLKFAPSYADAADAFGMGEPDGVVAWVVLCCQALEAGGREALALAER